MRARCIALTTYKRDGTAVTTPMWAAANGERILTTADFDSWKLKRIRKNPDVQVAPCSIRGQVRGDFVAGRARLLGEAETAQAIAAKKRRYLTFRVMVRFRKPQVGIEIVPRSQESQP